MRRSLRVDDGIARDSFVPSDCAQDGMESPDLECSMQKDNHFVSHRLISL